MLCEGVKGKIDFRISRCFTSNSQRIWAPFPKSMPIHGHLASCNTKKTTTLPKCQQKIHICGMGKCGNIPMIPWSYSLHQKKVYTCGKIKYSKLRAARGKVGGAPHPTIGWSKLDQAHFEIPKDDDTRTKSLKQSLLRDIEKSKESHWLQYIWHRNFELLLLVSPSVGISKQKLAKVWTTWWEVCCVP